MSVNNSKRKLPPHYGHGVSGERFWLRPELDEILYHLRNGSSVSLFGLRRTGKSSLLKQSALILREEAQFTLIQTDGQSIEAISAFFYNIVQALPVSGFKRLSLRIEQLQLPEALKGLIAAWRGKTRETTEQAQLVPRYWASYAQAIADCVPIMDGQMILVIDEISYLCENLYQSNNHSVREVERFLSMLRTWREAGMVMVMAGSIGIRQYLLKIGVSLNLLSGVNPVYIKEFSPQQAGAMLQALARHQALAGWDEHSSQAVLDNIIGLFPGALQLAFSKLAPHYKNGARPGRATIDQIFNDELSSMFEEQFYRQFDMRYGDYDAHHQQAIHVIFTTINQSRRQPKVRRYTDIEQAVSTQTEWQGGGHSFNELLDALLEDGFLFEDKTQGLIGFANAMVAHWWQRGDRRRGRRRQAYSPVTQAITAAL